MDVKHDMERRQVLTQRLAHSFAPTAFVRGQQQSFGGPCSALVFAKNPDFASRPLRSHGCCQHGAISQVNVTMRCLLLDVCNELLVLRSVQSTESTPHSLYDSHPFQGARPSSLHASVLSALPTLRVRLLLFEAAYRLATDTVLCGLSAILWRG